ncbi:hypothetical protein Dimus_020453 [Dionaea muscipula]
MVSLAPKIIRGGEAIGSVFSILDRHTKIDANDPAGETVESIYGDINPGWPEPRSGKNSVVSIIERFYDPTVGKVLIDGKDIRRLNLKSLRD